MYKNKQLLKAALLNLIVIKQIMTRLVRLMDKYINEEELL